MSASSCQDPRSSIGKPMIGERPGTMIRGLRVWKAWVALRTVTRREGLKLCGSGGILMRETIRAPETRVSALTLARRQTSLPEVREPRAESREPRAESREPRAESREPRAESREPRAESREPRAESREPRAESREPRAESREPRAESREPRAESREPRAESREPRAESREPRAELRPGSPIAPAPHSWRVATPWSGRNARGNVIS